MADVRHPLVKLAKRYTQSSQRPLDFRRGRQRHTLQKRIVNERENSVGILFLMTLLNFAFCNQHRCSHCLARRDTDTPPASSFAS